METNSSLIDLARRQTQVELFRTINKRAPLWISSKAVTREYGLKSKSMERLRTQGKIVSRKTKGKFVEWDELLIWIHVTNINMKKSVKTDRVVTYSRVTPIDGESAGATESRLRRQAAVIRGFVTSNGLEISDEILETCRDGITPEFNKVIEWILLGDVTMLVIEEPSRVGIWNWPWLQDLCERKGVALMAPSRKPSMESRLEVKEDLAEILLRWRELTAD